MKEIFSRSNKRKTAYVSDKVHPQTLSVVRTRCEPLGIEVQVRNPDEMDFSSNKISSVLLQCPDTEGTCTDYNSLIARAHENGVSFILDQFV